MKKIKKRKIVLANQRPTVKGIWQVKNGKNIPCSFCGKEFYLSASKLARPHKKRYCSTKCMGEGRRFKPFKHKPKPKHGVMGNCAGCGVSLYYYPREIGKKRYCSASCAALSIRGVKKITQNCKYCQKEYQLYPSYLLKRKSSFCSKVCEGKWKSQNTRGENSPTWQGGKSSEARRLRNSLMWREWRKIVFSKDNFTCQGCGKRGGYLEPHHIKPFAYYPALRFEPSNGVTLCRLCHNKTKVHYLKIKPEVICG